MGLDPAACRTNCVDTALHVKTTINPGYSLMSAPTPILSYLKAMTLGALIAALPAALPAYADEEYLPLQVYRQGPYAAGGTGFFGGMIDYMNLINMRDGGVNGVKLT